MSFLRSRPGCRSSSGAAGRNCSLARIAAATALLTALVTASPLVAGGADFGASAAQAAVAVDPPCFGAAARDLYSPPCSNPDLRLQVSPTPLELRTDYAGVLKADGCARKDRSSEGVYQSCTFGPPAVSAARAVALIGDSHAGRWRRALRRIAPKQKWSVVSTTRVGCPFNTVMRPKKGWSTAECLAWKRAIPAWLASKPEVDTLFVSQLARPFTTKASFEKEVAGYQRQWKLLGPTIKQIIVLRDNPKIVRGTLDCIERAIADKRNPGLTCAAPRSRVLDAYPDAAATAALRMRRANIGVVDLTSVYCGQKLCFPVIGGVLVNSDNNHLTPLFVGTLAPLLLRALQRGKWIDG